MTVWRKSSHSGGTGGDCVELAHTQSQTLVRDSKNPHGSTLHFPTAAFDTFLRARKHSPTAVHSGLSS
ncbi:DUF397 domain-containing protein [Saccharothrix sp.]|uniref:DUF397 domain-containing protein n=1 Tax=Saccharothrix sp. TaxID=1873460 RepID=UPI002811D460|nr:DUF397 domain-containing protein [Saccharothrix sp.]